MLEQDLVWVTTPSATSAWTRTRRSADEDLRRGTSTPGRRSGAPFARRLRRLRSFQVAQAVYDGTVVFCERFVDKRPRTHDQMVQAARSGRQNIAEGSRVAATSARTELKLVGVARASLDELLLDYEDFLRQRGLRLWQKDDPEALRVRALGQRRGDRTDSANSGPFEPYRAAVAQGDTETAANTIVCLIHQANYLLDRQLAGLERQFLEEGGFSERMYAARNTRRGGRADRGHLTDRTDPTDQSDPTTRDP